MELVRRTTIRTFKNQAMGIMVIAMLVLAAVQVSPAHAANITSTAAGGDWNSASTWSGGIVPGAADSVTIASGATVTVTANASADSLTFASTSNSSSTVSINPGVTLGVTNAVTIQRGVTPAINTLAVGAGSLTANRISFTDPAGTNTGGHVLTISTGTASFGNIVGNSAASATITFSGAGTLQIGGTIYTKTNGSLNTVAGSTVEYNGTGPQSVPNFAYSNLTLSGSGVKTLLSGVGISGNLTLAGTVIGTSAYSKTIGGNVLIGAGSELDMGSSSTAFLTVHGTTTIGGTLGLNNTANKTFTGNVVINSGGTWNEPSAALVTFGGSLQNDGSFTSNAGLHTFNGVAATIGGAHSIAIPSLKINGGLTNNGVLTVSTVLAGAGSLTNGAGATLNFGAPSMSPTLTASAADNTVNYNGGAQTVYPTAYDILVLRGSGAKSILAGTSVATNLSIAPTGTANASIAAGQNIPVGSLLLGGALQVPGTWGGGPGSGATHVDTTYFADTTGKLTVSGKSVNVTANPQSKTYGDPDPVFTYTSSNPAVSFTGSLSRASGAHVGSYPITIGTLSAGFYSINFTSANLTINQKALTQGTVDDKYIAPGDPDPVFTVTYTGLVAGDTFGSIDTPPHCSVTGAHSTAGDYPILCDDGSGSDNDYNLSGVHYTSGMLHVTNAVFGPIPAAWNFGLVKAGTTSASQDFYINNTGSSSMVINTFALGGLNPGQFHITGGSNPNHCAPGSSVSASSFCIVTVVFKPTSAGTKSALLLFTDTAAGSPHSIPLSGRGMGEVAVNGGFNLYPNTSTKIPTGWVASQFSTFDGKNTLVKQEGIASIKITNGSLVTKTLTQTRSLSGGKGSAFILSVWAKGQSIPLTGPAVRVVVQLYNGSMLVQTTPLNLPNGTYIFGQKKVSFVAPAAYNKVVIQLIYAKGAGSVWFDGLSLLRAP